MFANLLWVLIVLRNNLMHRSSLLTMSIIKNVGKVKHMLCLSVHSPLYMCSVCASMHVQCMRIYACTLYTVCESMHVQCMPLYALQCMCLYACTVYAPLCNTGYVPLCMYSQQCMSLYALQGMRLYACTVYAPLCMYIYEYTVHASLAPLCMRSACSSSASMHALCMLLYRLYACAVHAPHWVIMNICKLERLRCCA